jgi:hypothetical protein
MSSENLVCDICNTTFKNSSSLNLHKKTAKYCLKLRNNTDIIYECEYCNRTFNLKSSLMVHYTTCKYKKQNIIENEYQKKIKEYEEKYNIIKSEKLELQNKYDKLEEKYKATLEKLASKAIDKAIEKAGNKTTNNYNISNRNRIIQALQPLTDDYMRNQVQYLTYNNVKNGTDGLAHFASTHTFKDRIFCSDVSRLNFIFKNEDDEVIKDPEGVEITKKFIDINKEELLRFLEEYFYHVLKNLEQDLDAVEYKYWSERREYVIATRSVILKGNNEANKEYYTQFKKNFLTALSELVKR